MTVPRVLLSSKRQDWRTSRAIFDPLHARYGFTLDLHASDRDHLLPRYGCELGQAGLGPAASLDLAGEVAFSNSPFSTYLSRVAVPLYARREATVLAAIMPAKPCAGYWQEGGREGEEPRGVLYAAHLVHFLRGRATFDYECQAEGCAALATGNSRVDRDGRMLLDVNGEVATSGGTLVPLCAAHALPNQAALNPATYGVAIAVYLAGYRPEGLCPTIAGDVDAHPAGVREIVGLWGSRWGM